MSETRISTQKTVGALTGAAVGDALGWPQENRSQILGGKSARRVNPKPEFRHWERSGGNQFARYIDPVAPGEYSDDTQLLLAVARACLHDDWYDWLTSVELPVWPLFERGGGRAILSASRAWADKRPPWIARNKRDEKKIASYFNAGANGVAMRIAPHAIRSSHDDPGELMTRVVRDGLTTHGHPRALIGACLHALAVRHAVLETDTLEYGELLDAVSNSEIWRLPDFLVHAADTDWIASHRHYASEHPSDSWARVVVEVDELIGIARGELARGATGNDQRALNALGCFDNSQSGSGTVTAVAAIYVASRAATRPMSGLLRTGFLDNADTDTLCSMTGSLLGAVHGTAWLGELLSTVQDREYIRDLAIMLASGDHDSVTSLQVQTPIATSSNQLRKWSNDVLSMGSSDIAPDGRPWQIREFHDLDSRTRNSVIRVVGVTFDGQTLIHDKVTRPHDASVRNNRDMSDVERTANADRSGSAVSEGFPKTPPRPNVMSIKIHVTDLAASTKIFAEVLGLQVRVHADRTEVGDFLVLGRRKHETPCDEHPAVITVRAGDLATVADRASAFPNVQVAWSKDRTALWIKEPSLNNLRVISE